MDSNIGKMEEQLKQWGAKLDELVAKADQGTEQAKADYRKRLDDLKAARTAAEAKFTEYKAAGREKWGTLQAGIETAWSAVDGALKKLAN